MSQQFGRRRQQAKAETRRIILEAAYALFEEKGYEKTTMRELAAKAEVGLGTIFQHFSEKKSLAVAAFEEDMEAEVERAFSTLPSTDIKKQLLHFGRVFYTLYASRPQLFRVILNVTFFTQKETAEKIDSLVFGFWEKLADLFQEAIERGEIREGIDIPTAVAVFWANYSLALYFGLKSDPFDINAQLSMLERMVHQHFEGIAL